MRCGDYGGTNNKGDPCARVAGWGVPGTDGGRCKTHLDQVPEPSTHVPPIGWLYEVKIEGSALEASAVTLIPMRAKEPDPLPPDTDPPEDPDPDPDPDPEPPEEPDPEPAPVRTITLSPATAELLVGDGTRVTGVERWSTGDINHAAVFVWRTSAGDVATVDQSGAVVAVSEGKATITASRAGREGSMEVTVREEDAPPAPTNVVATRYDDRAVLTWEDQSGGTAWHRVCVREPDGADWETREEVRPGVTVGSVIGIERSGQRFGVLAIRAGGRESEIVEAG